MNTPRNTIFYLIGPPGVGKYTVGKVLAERTGARLLHNHYWNNIIFNLVHQDGLTPLPNEIWAKTGEVRRAVFSTIEDLSPPDWSFIFTHAAMGDGDELDHAMASEIGQLSQKRQATLHAVNLTCGPEELCARVQSPGRSVMMKDLNGETALENALLRPFDPKVGQRQHIDTSGLSAEEVAELILGK